MTSSYNFEVFIDIVEAEKDLKHIIKHIINSITLEEVGDKAQDSFRSSLALKTLQVVNKDVKLQVVKKEEESEASVSDKLKSHRTKRLKGLCNDIEGNGKDPLSAFYVKFSAQLIQLVKIVRKVISAFDINEDSRFEIAIQLIHIFFYLKNVPCDDTIFNLVPVSEDSKLHIIYTTIIRIVQDYTTIKNPELSEKLLGNEYDHYRDCLPFLKRAWVKLEEYNEKEQDKNICNIVKKAREVWEFHTNSTGIWSKLKENERSKYVKIVECYFVSWYYNDTMKKLAAILYGYEKIHHEEIDKLLLEGGKDGEPDNLESIEGKSLESYEILDVEGKFEFLVKAAFIYHFYDGSDEDAAIKSCYDSYYTRYLFKRSKTFLIYTISGDRKKSLEIGFKYLLKSKSDPVQRKKLEQKPDDTRSLYDKTMTKFGINKLHWACYFNDFSEVKSLISAKSVDRKLYFEVDTSNSFNFEAWTPLTYACKMGHPVILRHFKAAKILTDENIKEGIYYAACFHQVSILEELINSDWSFVIDKVYENGLNILHKIVLRSSDDGVKTLYTVKSKIGDEKFMSMLNMQETKNNYTPLYIAAYNGDAGFVKALMTIYLKDNKLFDKKENPLIFVAASRGHDKVVKVILEECSKLKDPESELTKSILSNLEEGFKLLSKALSLNSKVIWELSICYQSLNYLSNYRADFLYNADAVDIQNIYKDDFLQIKPFAVEKGDIRLKIRENENLIDVNGDYCDNSLHELKEMVAEKKLNSKKSNQLALRLLKLFLPWYLRWWYRLSHIFEEKMKVSFYTFDVIRTYDIQFLNQLVMKVYAVVGLDVFKLEFVKVSVKCAWERYGLAVHLVEAFLYSTYLMFFSVTNAKFNSHKAGDKQDDYTNLVIWLTIYTCIMTIYWGSKVLNPYLKWPEYEVHLGTYHTYAEIWTYSLVIGANTSRIHLGQENDISSYLMSFATILLYTRIMYFLRPIEATGPLVGMIEMVFLKIRTFLFIMFMVLMCFAQAMYLLSWRDDPSHENFGKSTLALVLAFKYMTGQSDYAPSGTFNSSIANIVVVLFALICTIILLNLLISIISAAYDEISPHANAEWYRQTCKVLRIQPEWLREGLEKFENNMSSLYTITTGSKSNKNHNDEVYPPNIVYVKRDLSVNNNSDENKTAKGEVCKKCEDKITKKSTEEIEKEKILKIFKGLETPQFLFDPNEEVEDIYKLPPDTEETVGSESKAISTPKSIISLPSVPTPQVSSKFEKNEMKQEMSSWFQSLSAYFSMKSTVIRLDRSENRPTSRVEDEEESV